MKQCKRCGKMKALNEFYAQHSNRDGLKTTCKECSLNRYEPVGGTLRCKRCAKELPAGMFTVLRTNKTGRMSVCKKCVTAGQAAKRHALRPVYTPASGKRLIGVTYVTKICAICGQSYQPCKRLQKRCTDCCALSRSIQSHLRREHKQVSTETADVIAKSYVHSKSCCYCGRVFSKTVLKSYDHYIPLCLNRRLCPSTNIKICCLDCNRSKARLSYRDWLSLCKLVIAHST